MKKVIMTTKVFVIYFSAVGLTILQILNTVHAVSESRISSAEISAGAFEGMACLHSTDCNATNTILTCDKGKCICPMEPQLSYRRGNHPLNTIWDNEGRKCLSVKDSACDVYFPKSVYCQHGLECKPDGHGFGQCSASAPYKDSAQAMAAQMTSTMLMIFVTWILY